MSAVAGARAVAIRPLRRADVVAVTRIDAGHTGGRTPPHRARVFRALVGGRRRREDFARKREGVRRVVGFPPTAGRREMRVGLAACAGRRVVGYLLGEVRAFEFGSDACGWVLALGVDPGVARRGVASALLAEAARRFAAAGIRCVRTMVRRNDVPVLAFFRRNGFVGGPFVQLELDVGPRSEG
jgi:ribosomal protein S18 acetylase RimI-like enzyme